MKVGTDVILRDQIIEYLQRMKANPDPGDLQFVKDKALDFCRKQALKAALHPARNVKVLRAVFRGHLKEPVLGYHA